MSSVDKYDDYDTHEAAYDRVQREYADYLAFAKASEGEFRFPHCDQWVLHHPLDECLYCNRYASHLQLYRHDNGIAFTGRDPNLAAGERPCPATQLRPLDSINHWHGNIPWTSERQAESDAYWAEIRVLLAKMDAERDPSRKSRRA